MPPVTRLPFRVAGDFYVYGSRGRSEEIPDELSIRGLLAVDWLDQEQVAAFLHAHGSITRTASESELLVAGVEEEPPPPHAASQSWVHWRHAGLHLWQAQLLASHVLAYLDEEPVAPVWQRLFHPTDEAMAWKEFQRELNTAIGWYSARLEVVMQTGIGDLTMPGLEPIGLYSALCLQIFNVLVEGLPAHRCANKYCRQRFIRQDGRAQAGQYRTIGVDYCSNKCAKAQTQRNYYQRQQAKKVSGP